MFILNLFNIINFDDFDMLIQSLKTTQQNVRIILPTAPFYQVMACLSGTIFSGTMSLIVHISI